MSEELPVHAWDDTRLDAAYAARFDRPTPPGLANGLAGRLASTPRPTWSGGWAGLREAAPVLIVAIAVVVLAVGISLPTLRPIAPASPPAAGGPTTSPSPASASPGPSESAPLPWPFPAEVSSDGATYDVMTVDAAIAVRDGDPADRMLAVAGWESFATDVRFCTIALPGILGQLENQCVYNRWLADVPEPLTSWYDPPVRPAFRIAWDPGLGDDAIRFAGGSFPRGSHTAHVLVGHFHDPLAGQCTAEIRDDCDATFVVTDIAWSLTAATFSPPPTNLSIVSMSVDEALGVRDNGDAPVELAVGGWYLRETVPCLAVLTNAVRPLEDCINGFTWLMANPESLHALNPDGSGSIHPPAGPAFNLAFDVDSPSPEEVPLYRVLVGHFHDVRAAGCPDGERRTRCDRVFVVDAVWVVDAPPPTTAP
jgi:hypothetical protein